MGLDIYLSGRLVYARENPDNNIDGYPVEEVRVKLGYWRKDWTLHNAMCALLENGCTEEMSLSARDLRRLLGMIQAGEIKNEDGSIYTGEGCAEYGAQDTTYILAAAIEWIEKTTDDEWRDATYRGSW